MTRTTTRISAEAREIDNALDALLIALMAERAKDKVTPADFRVFDVGDEDGNIPTRERSRVLAIAKSPLKGALRLSIWHIGQLLCDAGGVQEMQRVAERVAAMDAADFGRRYSIMDSAWDGIGNAQKGHWIK